MLKKLSNLLLSADESNVYLAVGVAFLFIGVFYVYPPASFVVLGLIFIGLAYLQAQKEGINGPTQQT